MVLWAQGSVFWSIWICLLAYKLCAKFTSGLAQLVLMNQTVTTASKDCLTCLSVRLCRPTWHTWACGQTFAKCRWMNCLLRRNSYLGSPTLKSKQSKNTLLFSFIFHVWPCTLTQGNQTFYRLKKYLKYIETILRFFCNISLNIYKLPDKFFFREKVKQKEQPIKHF